jgi:hypothetical protein
MKMNLFFKRVFCVIFLLPCVVTPYGFGAIDLHYANIECMKMSVMPCRISMPHELSRRATIDRVKEGMETAFRNFKSAGNPSGGFSFEDDGTANPNKYKAGLKRFVGEEGLAEILAWAQALTKAKMQQTPHKLEAPLNSKPNIQVNPSPLMPFFTLTAREGNTLKAKALFIPEVANSQVLPSVASLMKNAPYEVLQQLRVRGFYKFYGDGVRQDTPAPNQSYNALPPALKARVLAYAAKPFSLANTYLLIENLSQGQEPFLNNGPALQNKGQTNAAYWIFYCIVILMWLSRFSGLAAQPKQQYVTQKFKFIT